MINGDINSNLEAVISLEIIVQNRKRRQIDAVIDTGYNGYLTLTPALVANLRLTWLDRGSGTLADDSEIAFDIYVAHVVWNDKPREIPVDVTESTPLIGMALMEGYELKAQIRSGGKVTLKPLPRGKRI
jgi:clan AA aspartic protease